MAHVLYRFYSKTGQLLYVGITMNVEQRFQAHRHTKAWWDTVVGITLEHYPNREELAAAERRAIEVERPLHNIARPKFKSTTPPEFVASPSPLIEDPPFNPEEWFVPSPEVSKTFEGLFGNMRRETRYGWVNDEEYAIRDAAEKARWDAVRTCQVCDSDGYDGRNVCRHPILTQEQQRQAAKDSLQVIDGGV